jgi:hypothetical protein
MVSVFCGKTVHKLLGSFIVIKKGRGKRENGFDYLCFDVVQPGECVNASRQGVFRYDPERPDPRV